MSVPRERHINRRGKPRSKKNTIYTCCDTNTRTQRQKQETKMGPNDQGMDLMSSMWFHFELKILELITCTSPTARKPPRPRTSKRELEAIITTLIQCTPTPHGGVGHGRHRWLNNTNHSLSLSLSKFSCMHGKLWGDEDESARANGGLEMPPWSAVAAAA